MKSSTVAALLFSGLMVFGLGYCVGEIDRAEEQVDVGSQPDGEDASAPRWTCPMHPQIRVRDAVPCPLCGMALVEIEETDDPGPRRLRMSVADAALADIATAPVERRYVTRQVRLVGGIDFDETRVKTIAARVPGRLERLFVDYTGVPVRRGDHLVELYSPDLFTAQQELLEAESRLGAADPQRSGFLAESDKQARDSAEQKLLEWGMSEAKIDDLLRRGTAEDRIGIDAPIAGVVVQKFVDEGDYVQTGTRLYRIAELDRLWVRIAVYEQDLPWIRFGQSVSLTTEALPGEVFGGQISFVDPVLDERTRTVRVRVQVDNPDGLLRPGMFVRAVVDARLAQGGKVMDPSLAGKWISPMHPEIVKDGPGTCDVCGMDLVPAEDLGFVAAEEDAVKPLVVPYTAVLPTGRRAVVYVKVPGQAAPTFEGREVVLGPRAGDDQVVLAGLAENELVVVNGAFKIDSALQIRAKPSLLSMGAGGAGIAGPRDVLFVAGLEPVWAAYFGLQRALVASDDEAARAAFGGVGAALAGLQPGGLDARAARVWDDERRSAGRAVAQAAAASDLEALREAFHDLSRAMIAVDVRFGHAGARVHRETFCPMAFDDRGASWLQLGDEVRNPYFGDAMLVCGEFRRLLPGWGGDADPALEAGDPVEVEDAASAADPGAGEAQPIELPRPVLEALTAVFEAAIQVQRALAADDHAGAIAPLEAVEARTRALLARLDEAPDVERERLRQTLDRLGLAVEAGRSAADLAARRAAFEPLSTAVLELVARYGHAAADTLAEAHCPMAFDDRGASWLQRGADILNPYFGSEMLTCGSVEREFPARED